MRIGEVLVEQRKLRQSDLARALSEKPADKRLCSFLIAKGLVDFDDASRALGEQKGVACALAKHLAGRDPTLAKLIPAELGRASFALPIGKSSKGVVIVCVRDPAPALLAALRQATKAEITMVIAPAARLEHLVADAYGSAPTEEYDVDFNTDVGENPAAPPPRPPLPDMDALDPKSVRLALTDLDDARVDKDPSQSGQMTAQRPTTLAPVVIPPAAAPSVRAPKRAPVSTDPKATRPMSLEAMQLGLEHATSREAATDLVLAYIGTRWATGLVLALRDKNAIGYRGHRVVAPESISLALSAPSTVQRAVETRFVSAHAPDGAAQESLARALDRPKSPAAAPVSVQGHVVAVIAVGDLLDGTSDLASAAADLGMLAETLGAAYQRILGR